MAAMNVTLRTIACRIRPRRTPTPEVPPVSGPTAAMPLRADPQIARRRAGTDEDRREPPPPANKPEECVLDSSRRASNPRADEEGPVRRWSGGRGDVDGRTRQHPYWRGLYDMYVFHVIHFCNALTDDFSF